MTKTAQAEKLPTRILQTGYLLILALLPIHAVLSVWLESQFGFERVWQSWKELMLLIMLPVAGYVLVNNVKLRQKIFGRTLNQLIMTYFLLQISLALVWRSSWESTAAGLVFNLRFLGIFLLAQLLIELLPPERLRQTAVKVVGLGGMFVVGFGLLQLLASPPDWMSWFGYGPETIEPYITIDKNPDFVRINSSLRGPNPLGLYLILFASLVASWWLKKPAWLKTQPLILPAITFATVATLYATHSRSSWLGASFAVGLLIFWLARSRRMAYWFIALVAFASLLVGVLWKTDFIQNVVLHDNPGEGPAEVSTLAHFDATLNGLEDFAANAFGQGPGSAGPASFYTDSPKIAENYYIQIGQEVGVVGLALFLVMLWFVVASLWRQRKDIMPAVLLASFVGLSLANLFLHVWAQDEISLIWWGLAGLWYKE